MIRAPRVRRLDHVGIAVRETGRALEHFAGRLGLTVVHAEELDEPHVRLTYLDAGNAFLQLVEPLDGGSDVARFLEENGEGVHHVCFAVDDVLRDAGALGTGDTPPRAGQGRGRVSAFVPGPPPHGVRLECTQFVRVEDVDGRAGWLPG
jgi:methylmalonyl-CoA/ethylmalonyl-CoA epimerase